MEIVDGKTLEFTGVDFTSPTFGPGQCMAAKFAAPEAGSTMIRVYEHGGPAGFRRAWIAETQGGAPLMNRAPCEQAPSFNVSMEPSEKMPEGLNWFQQQVWLATQPISLEPGKTYFLCVRNVTLTGREWTSNVGYKAYPPQ